MGFDAQYRLVVSGLVVSGLNLISDVAVMDAAPDAAAVARVAPGGTAACAVIGAGPAGLMAAERLAMLGQRVVIFERMPSPARKLLMAGRGGLNLTHSEPLEAFLDRYGRGRPALEAAIRAFPPASLIAWAEGLEQPTFVGSSGRVFPRAMKASPLLRAWLKRLAALGVELRLRHEWRSWTDDGALRFATPSGDVSFRATATVLALGGASWPRLGSTGEWATPLAAGGIAVTPLVPANCGIVTGWSEHVQHMAGTPLKRIALSIGARTVRGEAVVTRQGLEGGAVYALVPDIRAAIDKAASTGRAATVQLDLRPDLDTAALAARLAKTRGKQSLATFLRKAVNLPPIAGALLRESGQIVPSDAEALAARLKRLPIRVVGLAGLDRAISTAGGVAFEGLSDSLMLTSRPGTFVAGEMLDWEAPTGGYLLQACFATGYVAGTAAASWINSKQAAVS